MRLAATGLVALAAALAGCGGGGGSDSPSNPAPTQIEALNTWKNFLAADRTYVTRGTGSDNAAYEISTTIRPRGTAQMDIPNEFPAATPFVTYNSVEVTNSVKRNNAVYSNSTLLFYVLPSDFSVGALIDPAIPACVLPTSGVQTPPIPATAALNASGLLFGGGGKVQLQGNGCMKDIGFLNSASHNTLNWWYITDNGRPLFCVNYRTQVISTQIRDQESCFEVVNGSAVGGAARISLKSDALTLVTKNY